ncbi:MAG: preprotein translocase subunit SecG [Cellulosilyticaceae bacterium]
MEILKMVIAGVYVITAIAIIIIVLLQEGKSAGLGATFATQQESYWSKNKKNTLEGKFEKWTKITAALFIILALLLMIL